MTCYTTSAAQKLKKLDISSGLDSGLIDDPDRAALNRQIVEDMRRKQRTNLQQTHYGLRVPSLLSRRELW